MVLAFVVRRQWCGLPVAALSVGMLLMTLRGPAVQATAPLLQPEHLGELAEAAPDRAGCSNRPEGEWFVMSQVGAPTPRARSTAVWTGTELLVWGGHAGPVRIVDGGARYDPVADTWRAMATAGAPSPRAEHAGVWMDGEFFIWGGVGPRPSPQAGGQALLDGARYRPSTDTWTPVASGGPPATQTSLGYPKAVWTGWEVLLLTRDRTDTPNRSVGEVTMLTRYDPQQDQWSESVPVPIARMDPFSATWTGSELLVVGVRFEDPDRAARSHFGARWDPVRDSWRITSAPLERFARPQATTAWTGQELLLWGGPDASGFGVHGDGYRYDLAADAWSPLPLEGAPSPRSNAQSAWTGSEWLLWGGATTRYVNQGVPFGAPADGSAFDARTNTWRPLPASPIAGRFGAATVWANDRLLIFGGEVYPSPAGAVGGVTTPLGDGAVYRPPC